MPSRATVFPVSPENGDPVEHRVGINQKEHDMPFININTVPEDARSKILVKVKELSDLLNENGASILLNRETCAARLLPKGFLVVETDSLGDDADTYYSDEFEFIDLPVEIYDPNVHTIVKD